MLSSDLFGPFDPIRLLPLGYVELHERWQYAVAGLRLVDRPCLPLVYYNCARIFSLCFILSKEIDRSAGYQALTHSAT